MREEYKKGNEDLRPLFSLTVGEFTALLRSVFGSVRNEEAKVIPLTADMPDVNDVICIQGLMEFLGCSKASVHNYKKRGLPFYRVGRKVLFKKAEVLIFMKNKPSKKGRIIRMAA